MSSVESIENESPFSSLFWSWSLLTPVLRVLVLSLTLTIFLSEVRLSDYFAGLFLRNGML
jgi:hypothetical protein